MSSVMQQYRARLKAGQVSVMATAGEPTPGDTVMQSLEEDISRMSSVKNLDKRRVIKKKKKKTKKNPSIKKN